MTQFVKIYPNNPNQREIEKVIAVLKKGGLIIYPTDTLYGLGCDITNTKALRKIAAIKGVKLEKANFSFICSNLSNLSDYVKQLETKQYRILKRALPGAYTFILPGNSNLPKIFKNKKTVGIRVPNNNIARTLVKELGHPIVSTSIHDEDDEIECTTNPELIFEKWKNKVDLIIDGGTGGIIPSTVIDLSTEDPLIVRNGKGSVNIIYINQLR